MAGRNKLEEVSLKILCWHDSWFHLKLTILKPRENQCLLLMERFILSYANVPCIYPKLSSGRLGTSSWRLAGGTLSAPFWCLCQKLSLCLLYFNKTLLHKSSEQPSLVAGPRLNSSPLEVKNPGAFHGSATIFQEPAHECSQQNYSQETKNGINPHVHQLMKRYRKRCSLQTMGAKGTKSWHRQHHGWTLTMLG